MEKIDLKTKKIVFFDGVCHLCNGFVDLVISQDTTRSYLFAPLQGTTAAEILPLKDREALDTVIYFESGILSYRSSAILKILEGLGGFYRTFALLRILPESWCDFFYNFLAKNRYAWFGQRDFCRIPTAQERDYLLP